MNISIRQIEHFIAVAEALHFRRAAQLTNVAQPALSRSVQTLENELGFQLLARNNRNVKLTAAGEEFLAGSTQIIKSINALVSRAQLANQTEYCGLRVGYTYIAMAGKLRQFISNFEAQNSSIKINPLPANSTEQLEQLHREQLDVCFITGSTTPTTIKALDSIVVQENAFSVIVNENHPLANKQSISVDELRDEKIMFSSQQVNSKFNQHVRLFLNEAQINPEIEYVEQNHAGIIGLVNLGRGAYIATEGFGCLYAKGLKTLRLTGITKKLPTLMVWRKETESESATRFRDFVLNSLNQPNLANAPLEAEQAETVLD